MTEEKQFSEITWFWFHQGGFITLPEDDKRGYETLNQKTVKHGWRLVGPKVMKILYKKHKEIFKDEDRILIGTEESSIKVVSFGKNKGDILVPAIIRTGNVLVYHDKYPICAGSIPLRSNIAILAVR